MEEVMRTNKQPCTRDCPERTVECKKTCKRWCEYWLSKQEEYKRRAEFASKRLRPYD